MLLLATECYTLLLLSRCSGITLMPSARLSSPVPVLVLAGRGGPSLGQAWGRPGASLLGQPTPSERRGGKINRFRKFPNLSVRVRQLALAPGWVGPSPRRSVADRESPPDGGELALLWPEAVRVGRHDSNNSTYPRKSFRRRLDEISKPISKQQGSY